MRRSTILAVGLAAALAGCAAPQQHRGMSAQLRAQGGWGPTADIVASDGRVIGALQTMKKNKGWLVGIYAAVPNALPLGKYGVHIHAVGSCTGPDFSSAGGHWNPTG